MAPVKKRSKTRQRKTRQRKTRRMRGGSCPVQCPGPEVANVSRGLHSFGESVSGVAGEVYVLCRKCRCKKIWNTQIGEFV